MMTAGKRAAKEGKRIVVLQVSFILIQWYHDKNTFL
jgi:hypothetical protein